LTRPSSARLRAVVFDLDDTLYLERDYVVSGFRAVAGWVQSHWGVPAAEGFGELWQLFEDGVRGETFDRWLQRRGIWQRERVRLLVDVYHDHVPQISPCPGVPELLDRLRQQYVLGLVSDGPLVAQRRKLEALGLGGRFRAVVWSDDWGRDARKPDPRPFRAVLGALGVAPAGAVYVADNPVKDFVGARRAGVRTVRVRHTKGLYSTMEPPTPAYAPEAEVASLQELELVLETIERHEEHTSPPARPTVQT